MSVCQHEKKAMDYFDGQLSGKEKQIFDSHLKTCPICREKTEELNSIRTIFLQSARPKASGTLLRSYRRNLKRMFLTSSEEEKELRFQHRLLSFFKAHPLPLRVVSAAVLIFLGIIIGRKVMIPPNSRQIVVKPSIVMLSISPSDARKVHDFMVESEILLLAIVNTEESDETEMGFNKEVAQNLLNQSTFIENKANVMENVSLAQFLTRLETILLEVTNLDKEFEKENMDQVRVLIQENNLHFETKRFQQMFKYSMKSDV